MKWLELNLSRAAEIDRQVDEVCRTFEVLSKQIEKQTAPNLAQVTKARDVLRAAMHDRIKAMEQFYLNNDLDPRASSIDQCRIKLKRVLSKSSGGAVGVQAPQTKQHNAPKASSTRDDLPPAASPTPLSADASSAAFASPSSMPSYSSLLNPSIGTTPTAPNFTMGGSDQHTGAVDGEPQVLVRVVMTQEEFDELKLRRMAIKQFLRGRSDRR